ncbi:hypothetical protein N7510_004370 [Penicillium lagena]|uniref:uncharacterized protein n=1 Tax=Penicillium lagena TaxID=94218 RepID=UPI002540CBF0|nr:uncharacterized protein N7510_004370 [Penicillium lagena]KAJ5620386.1 hypothetical protein N7510_004370 [Penicillium lagena]
MTVVADPLAILPPEIVLRVLEFSSVSALASLTAVSKAWNEFIDVTHQEAIYTSESKTAQPLGGSRDLSFLSDSRSFSKLFENTASWKDLCKYQTLLARNWAKQHPSTHEWAMQIGNDPVWRFRADFKRRIFISTSHAGGLNVTDMDTGRILWRLPSTLDRDEDSVRPFAHLEYQDGMAVFDREGDAVEVWQTDLEDTSRGEFRRTAVLSHNCQTRGFQLSYWTLCVVSNKGQGFPPKLTAHLEIERGAVGHLDQCEDAVIYSIGTKGYYAYDKKSGAFLGALQPSYCTDRYHIRPPPADPARYHTESSNKDCLEPIKIAKGPLQPPEDPDHVYNQEDEWGAGMLNGDLFVGFSRAGRVFVCYDWRKALRDQESLVAHSSIIECESDGESFDLGGWLAVHNHRLMFEIKDRAYVVALNDDNRIQDVECPTRASYALLNSSAAHLAVAISFMAFSDDAIMTTYTTLGFRQAPSNIPGDILPPERENAPRIFPTKVIRIISLAPDLSNNKTHSSGNPMLPNEDPFSHWPNWRTETGLFQLISMLGDEADPADRARLAARLREFDDELGLAEGSDSDSDELNI